MPFAPCALDLGIHVVMLINAPPINNKRRALSDKKAEACVYECHWECGPSNSILLDSGRRWLKLRASSYLLALLPGWKRRTLKPKFGQIWQPAKKAGDEADDE